MSRLFPPAFRLLMTLPLTLGANVLEATGATSTASEIEAVEPTSFGLSLSSIPTDWGAESAIATEFYRVCLFHETQKNPTGYSQWVEESLEHQINDTYREISKFREAIPYCRGLIQMVQNYKGGHSMEIGVTMVPVKWRLEGGNPLVLEYEPWARGHWPQQQDFDDANDAYFRPTAFKERKIREFNALIARHETTIAEKEALIAGLTTKKEAARAAFVASRAQITSLKDAFREYANATLKIGYYQTKSAGGDGSRPEPSGEEMLRHQSTRDTLLSIIQLSDASLLGTILTDTEHRDFYVA